MDAVKEETVLDRIARAEKAEYDERHSGVDQIISQVCAVINETRENVLSKMRTYDTIQARNMIMYLLSENTVLTAREIAVVMNRKPSDVNAGVKSVRNELSFGSAYRKKWESVL